MRQAAGTVLRSRVSDAQIFPSKRDTWLVARLLVTAAFVVWVPEATSSGEER